MYVSLLYEMYGIRVFSFSPSYQEYELFDLLGFALPWERAIFIRADLRGERRRKVREHEMEHVRDPYASELEIRLRTGTLRI
jgi:hypothetical protein